ncbi:selenocysteine-specific translation elongation factor [Actinobacteria bacterium YIM 96077]|uniref:Selenocysteine-specific elongation factor n=1 Tax=Phytoactinopolyspora halophila TaxID=1981511 RepID=A0A329QSV0_9ACTN|nr:selenocysteine-specific translation elongation factor [Phytoactinopolyspora halophila]AYY14217.1 selenocysteine-specific translation elongation factor [Actinobacteria bacterium YIM 96077]RAW14759.1 selenocysteine-specific translation elongation factor [Phytoactinopolyspora halophila]
MHVVATAGHVDHGKSTLVRALTGMEPDRWDEEHRRGLTIDLGFAWTELPSAGTLAFVDVPGHHRFVPNMLAGVGPVPAVLFVVAADEGWMPQSAEHLDAAHALGVWHGLLAITRSDLADPAPAAAEALAEINETTLGDVAAIPVSAPTGSGLDDLVTALDDLAGRLPQPDVDAPVRLWVDRSFTIRGSGTVVTGTLPAGRLRVGDELEIPSLGRTAGVRALQCLGRPVTEAGAVARVAVNLRGVPADALHRGDAVLTPQRFRTSDVLDARLDRTGDDPLPQHLMLHIGSAAVTARVRPLGSDTVRLTLSGALPLRVGDRGLLREPGRHRVLGGTTVLDVAPPALTRRGAAAERARILSTLDGEPDEHSELRRRGIVRKDELKRMGVPVTSRPVAAGWVVDEKLWAELRSRLPDVVARWRQANPLETGPPVDVVRQQLDLPERSLVHALVSPPLAIRAGRVVRDDTAQVDHLPAPVAKAVDELRARLAAEPLVAPDATQLAELGLGRRELAAADRAGVLVRIGDGVVLLPESIDEAVRTLRTLSGPFTVSDARQAWGTTRRVAIPLLQYLDRHEITERLPDDRRQLR